MRGKRLERENEISIGATKIALGFTRRRRIVQNVAVAYNSLWRLLGVSVQPILRIAYRKSDLAKGRRRGVLYNVCLRAECFKSAKISMHSPSGREIEQCDI